MICHAVVATTTQAGGAMDLKVADETAVDDIPRRFILYLFRYGEYPSLSGQSAPLFLSLQQASRNCQ